MACNLLECFWSLWVTSTSASKTEAHMETWMASLQIRQDLSPQLRLSPPGRARARPHLQALESRPHVDELAEARLLGQGLFHPVRARLFEAKKHGPMGLAVFVILRLGAFLLCCCLFASFLSFFLCFFFFGGGGDFLKRETNRNTTMIPKLDTGRYVHQGNRSQAKPERP